MKKRAGRAPNAEGVYDKPHVRLAAGSVSWHTRKSLAYGGIDRFRLVSAFLIVGIHTYPLASVSDALNFGVVHVFSRIAVPFFLMITGYFVLPTLSLISMITVIKKTALLYAGATLLYLPVSIYADYYANGNVLVTVARNVIFDGTFYHLWYLPALIIGVLLFYALGRKLPLHVIFGVTVVLYMLGLLGDSYYGLAVKAPFLQAAYDAGFHVFSYTRNGLFYAPVFLAMGAVIAQSKSLMSKRISGIGFAVYMMLMLAEGFALRHFNFQRHDSMYIALIPAMFFLFQFMLGVKGKASPFLRGVSMWVFVLHPLFIICVRGMARVLSVTDLLVENSIVHFLSVCLLSFAAGALITLWRLKSKSAPFDKGRAWIELDMENLRHNVNTLRGILPDNCELMPAVKANAYGHGAAAVCRELNRLGVRAFCVASVIEGVELRKKRIKGDILILGYTHPEQFYMLRRHRLTQTVIDYQYAKTLNDYGKKLTVHVKIDTGMKRLGEPAENIENILRIFRFKNLHVTGVYTHFSARSNGFTQRQADSFHHVLARINDSGFYGFKTHAQSSYGVFACGHLSFDYARTGLALYGAYQDAGGAVAGGAFRPVLSVKARIAAVKNISAGEAAGYGSAFIAAKDTKAAVLSVGYADGIPRALSCGVGHVLINGAAAPVIGYICMDQMFVDITAIEGVKQSDIAVIIGQDGDREITVHDLAEQAGTIPNEILSRLGARLG